MIDRIEKLLNEVENWSAQGLKELDDLRVKYLSKKGEISQLFNDFRLVPGDQKRLVGQKLNELKDKAQQRLNELKELLENKEQINQDLDLSRSAYPHPLGTRHPLSIVRNEIIRIFSMLGFSIAEGPEIEDDWHVFSSRNFPPEHPARDMQDTFL
jgi:phenylalanyl-tRNA synthetase alpha chain